MRAVREHGIEDMENRFKPKFPIEQPKQAPLPDPDQPLLTDFADFLKHTRTALPLAVIGIFLMALVGFLFFAKPFLMPVLLAIILSFLLKPAVNFLFRLKISKWIGSLIVIGAFVSLLWLVFSNLVGPAKDWMA